MFKVYVTWVSKLSPGATTWEDIHVKFLTWKLVLTTISLAREGSINRWNNEAKWDTGEHNRLLWKQMSTHKGNQGTQELT